MVVLIIFPVILQTVINVIGLMLSIGGQGGACAPRITLMLCLVAISGT